MIYLDNNATTRVADEVIEAMAPWYRDHYGNPHSAHALGRRAHDGIEQARAEVASLLRARPQEIVFTSCGTESNAIAILGTLGQRPERRKIVTSAVEHPSVLALLGELSRRGEIELATVGVDGDGRLDLEALRREVDSSTLLVTLMLAQNETGVIHPVEDAARIAAAAGALLLVDAVQAAGKIETDAGALGADLLSISGHKLHAPKGIGALYVREGVTLSPIWRGGGQENGLRSGTEAVPLIAGLGCASRIAQQRLELQANVRLLRDALEARILAISATSRNGAEPRLPNTASLSFHGLFADSIVAELDAKGVCISAGAACHSGAVEPSSVMKAMGKPIDQALGTVRFSLSRNTTAEEIELAAALVEESVSHLRKGAAVAPRPEEGGGSTRSGRAASQAG
ncbi:MAG TPA: cysteine desulfurase family protein [Thermoanaerobaculia bacterium]|nr:cysteine desulfurase family protein [Thermoanaerobaculia bacterium]